MQANNTGVIKLNDHNAASDDNIHIDYLLEHMTGIEIQISIRNIVIANERDFAKSLPNGVVSDISESNFSTKEVLVEQGWLLLIQEKRGFRFKLDD